MDQTSKHLLKEARLHGSDSFPVAIYQLVIGPGEPVLECHWHDEAEFFLVLEGEMLFQVDTDYFPVRAGEAVYLDGGDIHAGHALGSLGCRCLAIVLDLSLLTSVGFDRVQEEFVSPLLEKKHSFPRLIRPDTDWEHMLLGYIHNIYEAIAGETPGYEAFVKGSLYLALHTIAGEGRSSDRSASGASDSAKIERLKKILAHIQDNYQRPIRIEELAGLLPMSEGQFCRFFKSMTRKTPIEYINTYRIRQAADLLLHTDRKISDITMDVGFDNVSYFIKVFRKMMHAAPSVYRKSNSVDMEPLQVEP
ncbi:MAG: AraC family transcriptional regulator [Gorillibacterium sp.]|nr:AraC family transcriptional regulator [Gorillibacterium sp.]